MLGHQMLVSCTLALLCPAVLSVPSLFQSLSLFDSARCHPLSAFTDLDTDNIPSPDLKQPDILTFLSSSSALLAVLGFVTITLQLLLLLLLLLLTFQLYLTSLAHSIQAYPAVNILSTLRSPLQNLLLFASRVPPLLNTLVITTLCT